MNAEKKNILGEPGKKIKTLAYYLCKIIIGISGDDIQKITEALKTKSFGILTEIDIKATLSEKLDVDFYIINLGGMQSPQLPTRLCWRR